MVAACNGGLIHYFLLSPLCCSEALFESVMIEILENSWYHISDSFKTTVDVFFSCIIAY